MISVKTSALMAAMAVLGTVAPAAFAQDFTDATGDVTVDDSFNYVDAYQSNSITKYIDQNIYQSANGYADDDSRVSIDQDASQGFCELDNQQNAASGGDSNNAGANVISADSDAESDDEGESESEATVDCS
jgi:hypothetical protein